MERVHSWLPTKVQSVSLVLAFSAFIGLSYVFYGLYAVFEDLAPPSRSGSFRMSVWLEYKICIGIIWTTIWIGMRGLKPRSPTLFYLSMCWMFFASYFVDVIPGITLVGAAQLFRQTDLMFDILPILLGLIVFKLPSLLRGDWLALWVLLLVVQSGHLMNRTATMGFALLSTLIGTTPPAAVVLIYPVLYCGFAALLLALYWPDLMRVSR
jgi:hypothetical protein